LRGKSGIAAILLSRADIQQVNRPAGRPRGTALMRGTTPVNIRSKTMRHFDTWTERDDDRNVARRDRRAAAAARRILADEGLDLGAIDALVERNGSVDGESLTPWWEQ
jgi:hypothetical protein